MNVELLDGGRQLAKLLCAYSMAAPAREVLRCPSRGLARVLQLLRIGVLWRAGHMKKEYCHIRLWRAGHVSPQQEKATASPVGAVAAIRSQEDWVGLRTCRQFVTSLPQRPGTKNSAKSTSHPNGEAFAEKTAVRRRAVRLTR
ncbi:hypothetical protein [Rhodopseudomonas sp.]|uniref:hypothetical protein n=1 Tax=Rhodopseudomonas sp. TaxID=1078 RepID=UPI003B3B4B93